MDDDIHKDDSIQNLRRELAALPAHQKSALATEVVRSLDPPLRTEFASEFVRSQEDREAQQRLVIIGVATLIIIAALVVLVLTLQMSPASIEYVGGVLTTLTGTVAGFIGGRATATSQQPTDQQPTDNRND